ncbi:MAG: LysM protein [Nevskia sp.]|nr:LysM protein [Nevskia sp.]
MQKYNAMRRSAAVALRFSACALLGALGACASDPQSGALSSSTPPAVAADSGPIMPLSSAADASASSGTLSLREDAPLRYVVKKGDTLWSIANYFLRDPWQWPQLWYTNGQVKNPHLIYPGDVLSLIMVDGHPRLAGPDVVEHLSPQVRNLSLDQALPAIPIEAIRNFLKGPRVLTEDEIKKAPYVVEYTGEHIDGSANNSVYVKKLPKDPATSWAIVQIGDEYKDPDTSERLGFEALPAGEGEIRTSGDPAEMLITKSNREVMIGDRLLPIETQRFDSNFYPHAPLKPVDGRIISVFDGVIEIPQYQIVALNRGSKAGLDPGTVLSIFQTGRVVPDPYGNKPVQLPEQYAGLLMVFKVTPKVSYALVMSATRPAHVYDKVHQPTPTHR